MDYRLTIFVESMKNVSLTSAQISARIIKNQFTNENVMAALLSGSGDPWASEIAQIGSQLGVMEWPKAQSHPFTDFEAGDCPSF